MSSFVNPQSPSSGVYRTVALACRLIFISVVFTALGMALGLFGGILWQVLRSISGNVDMTLAYRHVAFPAALAFGVVALTVQVFLELRTSRHNPAR